MKHANLVLGICFAFFLLCALSMDNKAYLLISIVIGLAWLYALISVTLAEKTVRLTSSLSACKVTRGDSVSMLISVSHSCPLPIAPVALKMRQTANTPGATLHLTGLGTRRQKVTYTFTAAHVGAMFPGVESYVISDVFGFFRREHKPDPAGQELLVLPLPFEVEPLRFAAGDLGSATMHKAMEDASSPADIRLYQQGDPLKRIHWKLSARKRDLMVRQFDQPALPDALLLLDTSTPKTATLPTSPSENRPIPSPDDPITPRKPSPDHLAAASRNPSPNNPAATPRGAKRRMRFPFPRNPSAPRTAPAPDEPTARLQDALLETAASVASCQLRHSCTLKIPLLASHSMEVSTRMGLPILLEQLARCPFGETEQFEKLILMQLSEMRKIGAVVLVTTRLTSSLVDLVVRLRRLGPTVRLYLCTFAPNDPSILPQVSRLQSAGAEVHYVTP